ncbi:thioredoxin [Sulfuriferula plumbiphila]|uniref:Thioredoxin n=1 Tax=Sulfuriferula plumbiphila TaxID=171865 RepID=A0A512L3W9_9PROT|nr:TlpA disulfide reductase family protein [Sulfuriferula plumbiphila]BBP05543.1 thioredoxin [Sulfuriferula plumbiphila]GEP29160.1 thioredoxin [Sulfuriferula plumbiphila]
MKKLLLLVVLGWVVLLGTAQARELQPYKGAATPPLVLKDLSGKTHNLKDYRGQVVLINFWATWCPPCRAEMPSMQRLKEKMADRPFVILAVDMGETEDAVQSYIREIKTDFTVLMDKDGHALKAWKVFAFPTSYVVDAQGKIRYGLFGSIEWDEADSVGKITGLLPPVAN